MMSGYVDRHENEKNPGILPRAGAGEDWPAVRPACGPVPTVLLLPVRAPVAQRIRVLASGARDGSSILPGGTTGTEDILLHAVLSRVPAEYIPNPRVIIGLPSDGPGSSSHGARGVAQR